MVEDDLINQELAKELLVTEGYSVDVAENGAEALDMARQSPYDLVLMDVNMPVMNGLDAARALRQLSGYHTTPVLAMTAGVFEDERQNCTAAGMNSFVAKPVQPVQLFRELQRWLDAAA